MKYKYLAYQLPVSNIKDTKNITTDVSPSKYPNKGLLKYGFITYFESNLDKLKLLDDPKYKGKDFYKIVNTFETSIKQHEEDIDNAAKSYFKNIIKNYDFWELLITFDLIDYNNKTINTLIVDDYDNSFKNSVIEFRNKFSDKTKDNIVSKQYKNISESKDDYDLIVINNNFDVKMNIQEQLYYQSLINYIILSLKNQKKGGHLVLKIYDTATHNTVKLLYLLQHFYTNIFITKPYTSDPKKSDKYIIATNFKNKDNEIINKLESIKSNMGNIKNKFVGTFLNKLSIPEDFETVIKYMNIEILNNQFIEINKLITYINSGNFFSDAYHNYLNEQINANKFWIETFLIEKKQLQQKTTQKNILDTINNNKKKIEELYNNLI
jgi:23S rRNA U2552 (ribose-2'-O)-methylase RlmE/FtsJ